jgi:L,D-transpeptidase ErfK/SrfK
MKIRTLFAYSLLASTISQQSFAATFNFPENPGDTVITQFHDDVPLTRSETDETLLDVARRFSLGQTEIVRLNPDVDRWNVKKGEIVRLPNKHILPDSPHEGITLNVAEYRMYYYLPTQPGQPQQILSFAHGVGRQDWKTPLGKTSVAKKIKDPVWRPPESIRREHAAMGDPLPVVVPAGPHNPLGAYALYLNLPGDYRIHGTDIDKIFGIGMQITHGCVRMYPEDIEQLYNNVSVGTPVYIVKQPIKVGWLDNVLYVEAHPDLEGEEMTPEQRYSIALGLIQKANNQILPEFNEQALKDALTSLSGIPMPIFERMNMPPIDTLPVNQPNPTPKNSEPAPIPPLTPSTKKVPVSPRGYYSPSAAAQGI